MTSTVSSQPPPLYPTKPRRALALDALRGFAILTMVLSGVIPWPSLLLRPRDVLNWQSLCTTLAAKGPLDTPSPQHRIWSLLATKDQQAVKTVAKNGSPADLAERRLLDAFNAIISDREFYQKDQFSGVVLPPKVRPLLTKPKDKLVDREVQWLNRRLFEAAFPQSIKAVVWVPAWMYHAQVPPPVYHFNPNLPGLTWVDLVFPFFLFSMGAAFPLALSKRLRKRPWWKVVLGIGERGFLLATFGVFLDHIRPYSLNGDPTTQTWFLALIGFGLLFAMYARLPDGWSAAKRWGVKFIGWGGALLFLLLVWDRPGHMFDANRRDIIIIILTDVAVFGSLAWLVTRGNWWLRVAVMGGLVAMRLSATVDHSWIAAVWNANPFPNASGYRFPLSILISIPHAIHISMISYLLIALPGAISGDLLLKWIQAPPEEHAKLGNWSVGRLWTLAALMTGFLLVCLVGLQSRWVLGTTLVCFALGLVGWGVVSNAGNENERFLKRLYGWGIAWLVIGLLFEPYEGGIKKDPATFSYFFVTAGLAVFLLMAFVIVIDIRRKEKWVGLLVANGQNPMIAYVTHGNLVLPLMNLTLLGGVIDRMMPGRWLGTLEGFLITLLVAVIVWGFTKAKIFWRT